MALCQHYTNSHSGIGVINVLACLHVFKPITIILSSVQPRMQQWCPCKIRSRGKKAKKGNRCQLVCVISEQLEYLASFSVQSASVAVVVSGSNLLYFIQPVIQTTYIVILCQGFLCSLFLLPPIGQIFYCTFRILHTSYIIVKPKLQNPLE